MQSLKFIYLCLCLAATSPAFSQNPSNPLLIHSNDPIAFEKIDAQMIRESVAGIIQISNGRVKQIIAGLKTGAGPGTTLAVYDDLSYDLNDLGMKLGLISQTYVSDSARDAANNGLQALSDYQTTLILNEPLYKALKSYAAASMSSLKPNQQKYIKDQLQIFENNGMKLDSAARRELQGISEKLTMIGLEFDNNISTSRDSIIVTASDLAGVPEDIQKKWKRPGGEYVLYINTPNSSDISKYAASESMRKKFNIKYNNRAYPKNIKVLDSLLYYRQQYAQKLGYRSYAAYALTDKMAGNPQAVWDFENNLAEKLAPQVTKDITSIRNIKHQMHPELADTIYGWDVSYYKNILLDTKYQLNTDEVKEYFEMNQTISGMFEVYHQLLGITVKETFGLPVWYDKVRTFDMYLGGKKIGSFYFDLYPRQNKYNHFACFGINAANISEGREILPVAALICNFPEAAKGTPILLDHSDVIILFHEFGHLVHAMVVRSDLASQPATLKADFVEAPSQFLENFCWQYPSLKIFAKNYKTGAVLPESLFNKMKAAEHVFEAYGDMFQVYYGMIDFTFEDKYDSIRGMDLTKVSKDLAHITQMPVNPETHMITAFTHLSGYGANYYGYLWSRVFAQDIFSVFEKNGVMDPKTGERYRKEILEVAGSKKEIDMLRQFLGREPNPDAFMRSIGL
ncbi:MAG: M3 family metallopeptidase [Bacteroidota bacterium]|nr:M3 family metallopeptidase [Bacteroidota bacterium]